MKQKTYTIHPPPMPKYKVVVNTKPIGNFNKCSICGKTVRGEK